jgi:hypothetical protein
MHILQSRYIVSVNGGGNLTPELEEKIGELESDIQDVVDNWNKKHADTRMKAELETT